MNESVPQTIAVIMDGNRRYAKEKGLPTLEGHRAGFVKFKEVANWIFDAGIKTAIFYAFSTENWKRAEEEVSYLMDLFAHALKHELADVAKRNVRVKFIGEIPKLPESVRVLAEKLEADTKDAPNGMLVIALSYGSRSEIVAAANKLAAEGKTNATEEEFRAAMWSADIPDPDLIIRTGGERRLSNFLLYQAAYSELFFTDTKWPLFSKGEFDGILADFSKRERRHGK